MKALQIKMSGITDRFIGEVANGKDGYWILQILSLTGTTPVLTPKASLKDDGSSPVARKLSPIDGSADVASASAPGMWTIKGPAPLVLSLSGNADVVLDALLYPVVV